MPVISIAGFESFAAAPNEVQIKANRYCYCELYSKLFGVGCRLVLCSDCSASPSTKHSKLSNWYSNAQEALWSACFAVDLLDQVSS